MLAACPQPEFRDGGRAVELARRGCELRTGRTPTSWIRWRGLCRVRPIDEAVTWANKSLELADAGIKEAVCGHVQLFRDGRPARFQDG